MLSLQLAPSIQAPRFPEICLTQAGFCALVPVQAPSWEITSLIRLDFSELQSFEVVRDQYQQWGIEFEQTIALHPSNPAFDAPAQSVGLMPMAHPFMAIQFHQPRQLIKGTLVGSRAIIVTAYDAENRVVAQYDLACYAASNVDSTEQTEAEALERLIPLHALHLQAEAISRIELTSASPFMLQEFCCI